MKTLKLLVKYFFCDNAVAITLINANGCPFYLRKSDKGKLFKEKFRKTELLGHPFHISKFQHHIIY